MSTPQMNESQLRDVLARVVPEAPDSVADPAPVVRAARTRRRAQVALAGGAVALVAIAGVLGGRALVDDDPAPQVADEVPLSGDPYSAAACPEVLPENGPLPDLSQVTAVRFCAAGFNGFPAQPGPPDALVEGIDGFADAVAALPTADPARCAAVDVIPSDSRLAFELSDGSLAFVPATMCTDVAVEGRNLDGADVTNLLVAGLDAQRDGVDYSQDPAGTLTCQTQVTSGPAMPGREAIVEATFCPADLPEAEGTPLDPDAVALVGEAWAVAAPQDEALCMSDGSPSSVLARTDRGDVVRLGEGLCGDLEFYTWQGDQPAYTLDITVADLIGS